jgi:hypothetical protein
MDLQGGEVLRRGGEPRERGWLRGRRRSFQLDLYKPAGSSLWSIRHQIVVVSQSVLDKEGGTSRRVGTRSARR